MAAAAAARSRRSVRSFHSSSSSIGEKPPAKPISKPASLPRRLLFPHLPPDADLPPLLTSSAAAPALNAEIYDVIALALRAFVNPWWTKLTCYDKDFLPAITRVLTAVIRAIETRLISADLAALVLRDFPTLLTQHYVDFRNAKSKLHTSYASGGAATLPQLFHHLQPHMAISPDGTIDEVYVRQAIDHVLKASLPPEDYDSEAERYIVREIVQSVLLRNVLPRVTQPWFIYRLILSTLGPQPSKLAEPPDLSQLSSIKPDNVTSLRATYSLQSLAIFFLSAVQSISGACLMLIHTYRQTRDTIKKVNAAQSPRNDPLSSFVSHPDDRTTTLAAPVPLTFPGGLAAIKPASEPAELVSHAPTPISVSSLQPFTRSGSGSTVQTESFPPTRAFTPLVTSAPLNYTQPSLSLLFTLLTPPPTPAPTLAAKFTTSTSTRTMLALAHTLSLPLTLFEPFLSRLLPYLLYMHVLSVPRLIDLVRAARHTLFPEGWPGPAPPDPSPEEQVALRAELGQRLLTSIPAPVALLLGPTPEAQMYTIDAMLDPLSNQSCNAHLVLYILDLVLLAVFPELGASESVTAASTESVGPAKAY
ncbi:uncharacterized protein FIBRA_04293 [Fibroporia radiculosa]|uniref:PXA domain-containing protein n=1 Tax=Fibroporia radiculosa TaxID=599839 RepID=J4G754_9APHY|nr:uncharacterized protein FIBRA_04293 [Fibroporia radiculosa]CCM02213.1 predicted protein [Fibroporia radiculosa]